MEGDCSYLVRREEEDMSRASEHHKERGRGQIIVKLAEREQKGPRVQTTKGEEEGGLATIVVTKFLLLY